MNANYNNSNEARVKTSKISKYLPMLIFIYEPSITHFITPAPYSQVSKDHNKIQFQSKPTKTAMNLSSLTINPNPFHSLIPLSSKCQSKPLKVSVITCSATTLTAINGNPNNFYKMLRVSPESATTAEIKRAYRSMALRYHPDVCRDASAKEESTRMFVQLNAAYETLSNPPLREEYDCQVMGLRRRMGVEIDEGLRRRRWEEQVAEWKRRSYRRMGQKGRPWGSSMRAQRMRNHD